MGHSKRGFLRNISLESWGYRNAPDVVGYGFFRVLAKGKMNIERLLINKSIPGTEHGAKGLFKSTHQ